jgi:hypothetical protein
LIGNVKELSKSHKFYDSLFMMDIIWFSDSAIFTQKIKLNVPETVIKGKVEFMACTDEMCLPVDEVRFEIRVKKK